MKLNSAFDTAVASCEDARRHVLAFVNRVSDFPDRPAHYRCVGQDARTAVSSFLDAAGFSGAYEVDASSLDPDSFTFRWKDLKTASDLGAEISDYYSRSQANAYYADGNPLRDTDAVTFVPPPDTEGDTPAEPECVDGTAAFESFWKPVVDGTISIVSGGVPYRPDMTSDYEPAVPLPHAAEQAYLYGKTDDPLFSYWGSMTSFRYVRRDENVVPVPGFFEAPAERTVGADEDPESVFSGYVAYNIGDMRKAVRAGRTGLVLFVSATLRNDARALMFCSDRNRLYRRLADIYENVYGCGGKFRVVVDPLTRVTVNNSRVSSRSDLSRAVSYSDDGITDYDNPFGVQAVLYVVPAAMAGDGLYSGPAAPEPVRVVGSLEEACSQAEFDKQYVCYSDLPAEWFAMTHFNGIGTRRETSSSYWGYYSEERRDNTAAAKSVFSTFANCITSSVERACSVDTAPGFALDSDSLTGSPAAAFAFAVGGVVRLAMGSATSADRCVTVPKARASGPHSPNAFVTAVYSGVTTAESPDIAGWLADSTLPFPDVGSDQGTVPEQWTEFIERLPGSGAMFRSAKKPDGTSRSYSVIVETNVPYAEFISSNADPLKTARLIKRAAVCNLMLRSQDATVTLSVEDGNGRMQDTFTNVIRESVVSETGGNGSIDTMLGDKKDSGVLSAWNLDDTSCVRLLYRSDRYGRLYVVVTLSGLRAYYGHLAYRAANRLRVCSSFYARSKAAAATVPDDIAVIPQDRTCDMQTCVTYAAKMLKSCVGDYHLTTSYGIGARLPSRFWTTAYRGPFVNAAYSFSGGDCTVPPKRWFTNTHANRPTSLSTIVAR